LAELLELKAAQEELPVSAVAPVTQPRQGYVAYYDTRRASARRRLDRTLELLRKHGIPADGVIVESDPVAAVRDAIHQLEPDEVIVSTHPEAKSGWLRRNVVDQMRRATGPLPFEHIVVDLAAEHGEANVLVLANQTVLGEPLLAKIRERAAAGPASFLIISPQSDPTAGEHPEAERRLRRALAQLRGEGIEVHGQVAHPDPFSAAMEAVHDERV